MLSQRCQDPVEQASLERDKVGAAQGIGVSTRRLNHVPTQRSATAFALGARTGVQITSAPVERHTSSNTLVNLVSRSRIRNLHATA